ncbi:MAG: alkyl sulfatase dimerization domain-containing protein [Erysipelotrichaceae bacterium]
MSKEQQSSLIPKTLEQRQAISNYAYEEFSDTVNPRLTERSLIFKKQVYQTKERFYTAFGYAVDAPVMVVGDDGLIIIDPCESFESMEEVWVEFRKISDLPIKAILYTHHHPDHWAGTYACFPGVENVEAYIKEHDIKIIAQAGFAEGVAKESGWLVDIKTSRSLYMYGSLLPLNAEGRINLGNGPSLETGRQDLVLPNVIVEKHLELRVAGMAMDIHHVPSECSDEICIWFPEQKVLHVAETIQGESFPNIYSIRGSNRNPNNWMAAIDLMRTFPAEHLIGNHMRPVDGVEASYQHLTDYRDLIQYTHDQTVRLINKGYTPENIVKELEQLPPHLFQRPRMGEHYGTFTQGVRLVYATHVGWFNGDAQHLEPHNPYERSKRYVDAIGKDKVVALIEAALESKDFKWAAELSSHLVTIDQNDTVGRTLKAKALRELGYLTENAPFRNWYITQAYNLEGKLDAIKEAIPEFNSPAVFIRPVMQCPVDSLFEMIKVKLNGPKAADAHYNIRFELTDKNFVRDVEIRNGVLEVHPANSKTVKGSIAMTQTDFAFMFTKMAKPSDFILAGKLTTDLSAEDATAFFDLFDGFTPLFDVQFPFQ